MIPVLGFATVRRFDLAERLLASIDYPVDNLVIVDNSGLQTWEPPAVPMAKKVWVIRVPNGLGFNGAWNLIIKSTPFAPYWLLINDDAHFAPGALEAIHANTDTQALNFVNISPAWSCVSIGERVVAEAGLLDEAYHPIYFDDNDWERRIDYAGIPKKTIAATVYHDNSSTLNSGFGAANSKTFKTNGDLLQTKIAANDYTAHGWSLKIRRDNAWD